MEKRYFSMAEVEQHASAESCWIVHENRVYDVSAFIPRHPGGQQLLVQRAGRDVSRDMEGPPHRHSTNARRWLQQYYIGELRREDDQGEEEELEQFSQKQQVRDLY